MNWNITEKEFWKLLFDRVNTFSQNREKDRREFVFVMNTDSFYVLF